MPDARLPIKVLRIPAVLSSPSPQANGFPSMAVMQIAGRANAKTIEEAETLAKT
jgi:hypothetical protein